MGLSCRSLLCRIGIQAPSKRSLDPLAVCSLIMTLLSPAYRSLSHCIDFNWDCFQSCLWIFLRCCHRVHVVHSHRLFLICHGGSIRKRSINRCFFPCMKMIRQSNHYFSQYIGISTSIVLFIYYFWSHNTCCTDFHLYNQYLSSMTRRITIYCFYNLYPMIYKENSIKEVYILLISI